MPGIDFGDFGLLLSVVVAFDFEVEKMDVKTSFLHGYLEEEIYLKQPEGFMVKGKKELVCRLKNVMFPIFHEENWKINFSIFT